MVIKYIAVPILKLNKIGKLISYHDAAKIIGNHFTNVQDKLLNVLQLQNNQSNYTSNELLIAGIDQKINQLNPLPFSSAIDLNENKKYVKFILPLFLVTAAILIVWPQIILKSSDRLVHYQTYYEKVMPFQFSIQNKNLQVMQTQDYLLQVKIIGEQIPNDVFIEINDVEYQLKKVNTTTFNYTFSNIQSTTIFQLSAAGFLSKRYELKVLPKPSLIEFNLELIYPSYINKSKEILSNTGDLQLPQGTKVNWVFNTKNTDQVYLKFLDSLAHSIKTKDNQYTYSRKFYKSNNYTLKTLNKFVSNNDSLNYCISVILDQFPSIDVTSKQDSLDIKNIFFSGQIRDDYGFTNLNFHFKINAIDSSGKEVIKTGSQPITILKNQISQTYFYFLDLNRFNFNPGDKLEYFFEVTDNDAVNGVKSAKTALMFFKSPTQDELNKTIDNNNVEIKKDLEESIKKTKQLQKDVNELSKKINDKNQLGYEEKKKIEELIKKQQELQHKVEDVKQQNEANNKQQNENSKTDESIIEKQKQLEQLFENVMSPEMKKLFEELNKLLENLDKNQIQEKLEELKISNKDIEKELDRNLEAFKQLEVDQKIQNVINKLEEIKNKEQDLNKKTSEKNNNSKEVQKPETSSKELEKKQNDIKNEFDELKNDLKELDKKNNELEVPNNIPKMEEKQKEISNDLQKSADKLSKNNKNEASESQKSAIDKMDQMQEEMDQAIEEDEEKQDGENAQALRQILENLLHLSFSQEALINDLSVTRIDNPNYVEIPKKQNKLKEDSKLIEDSLLALSKRVTELDAIVNREISAIHANMNKTVKSLADRNSEQSTIGMQYAMTSVNNLAVLLNESLEQMQKKMQAKKKNKGQPGKGKCNKPGSGENPSSSGKKPQSMKKMQEKLNQQLKQLKDALEKGQKPGDKPGQKPGNNSGQNGKSGLSMPGSSEQFAKMAAQQEALRRQMQALMDKLKNKGNNPGGDIANMMEETEKELVNKQLTNETMQRQQQILSRLLESEKAELEREQDEQRKSNEVISQNLSNPKQFLEYKRQKEKELEMLNTVTPSLTPYFKEKVNDFFKSLNKK